MKAIKVTAKEVSKWYATNGIKPDNSLKAYDIYSHRTIPAVTIIAEKVTGIIALITIADHVAVSQSHIIIEWPSGKAKITRMNVIDYFVLPLIATS